MSKIEDIKINRYICSQEHYWCLMLNTHDRKYGYNILPTHPEGPNKRMAEESKIKMSQSKKGQCLNRNAQTIYKYSIEGEYIESITNISKYCRDNGIHDSNLNKCANNKINTAYGFKWSYERK